MAEKQPPCNPLEEDNLPAEDPLTAAASAQPKGSDTNSIEPPPKYQEAPPVYGGQQFPNYGATVTQQPTVVSTTYVQQVQIFTDRPAYNIQCPNCQETINTQIRYETGILVWIPVLVMFVLLLWLCCWIPFFVDSLKDVVHICPKCRREIGRFKRL